MSKTSQPHEGQGHQAGADEGHTQTAKPGGRVGVFQFFTDAGQQNHGKEKTAACPETVGRALTQRYSPAPP
jgi:hypothetical protein